MKKVLVGSITGFLFILVYLLSSTSENYYIKMTGYEYQGESLIPEVDNELSAEYVTVKYSTNFPTGTIITVIMGRELMTTNINSEEYHKVENLIVNDQEFNISYPIKFIAFDSYLELSVFDRYQDEKIFKKLWPQFNDKYFQGSYRIGYSLDYASNNEKNIIHDGITYKHLLIEEKP